MQKNTQKKFTISAGKKHIIIGLKGKYLGFGSNFNYQHRKYSEEKEEEEEKKKQVSIDNPIKPTIESDVSASIELTDAFAYDEDTLMIDEKGDVYGKHIRKCQESITTAPPKGDHKIYSAKQDEKAEWVRAKLVRKSKLTNNNTFTYCAIKIREQNKLLIKIIMHTESPEFV